MLYKALKKNKMIFSHLYFKQMKWIIINFKPTFDKVSQFQNVKNSTYIAQISSNYLQVVDM